MDGKMEPPKRSAGALRRRRVMLPWPKDREFRILSIDGGGIRGIYPAAVLAGLERRYLGGRSVASHFDLIAGASTGGIVAIGLAAGLAGADLSKLYRCRGLEIFPPVRGDLVGAARRFLQDARGMILSRHDCKALARVLEETLGDRKFGHARNRLCIPAFDGRYGEVYIFKTPHHPDFKKDGFELMTTVAAATAAAPTVFPPLRHGGYTFVDGGVWANNPVMIALVDALTCFDVPRENLRILSLGCGDEASVVGWWKTHWGGLWVWRDIIHAAMRLQSQNALGQAGLLIGPERILRADPPAAGKPIRLDDWTRASKELPGMAEATLDTLGDRIADMFLKDKADPYAPSIDVGV